MKWSFVFILLLTHTSLFAKGGGKTSSIKAKSVPVITSDEAVTEISEILDEVISGERTILNKKCGSISYTSNASILDATVGDRHYYIFLVDQILNGINYLESQCTKTNDGSTVSISCIARTQDLNEKEKSLFFDFKYGKVKGYKVLFSCSF